MRCRRSSTLADIEAFEFKYVGPVSEIALEADGVSRMTAPIAAAMAVSVPARRRPRACESIVHIHLCVGGIQGVSRARSGEAEIRVRQRSETVTWRRVTDLAPRFCVSPCSR